ncbi:MAG: hypothetical protein JO255_03940 [Alphaproteobacteria bacterium]|nr:hypothetical protein [Alphaproteobacteria bacterium]
MITKSLAAIVAGVFGPKRAGDRRLADSQRAQLDQPSPSFSDPTRSVGFVVLAVLLVWAIGGFGELGLSGKGLVALTLGFLFSAGLAVASWRSSSSATAAVATTRQIGRLSAKREGALSP